jgi:predicted membrane channel-forming protein YqfA (hemolysin III family)
MLSQPVYYDVYLANKLSNKFFNIAWPSDPVFLSFMILVTMGWLSLTYFYQMPSHPMIIN